jgi:tetratricopeptide (TPR) repeat protein
VSNVDHYYNRAIAYAMINDWDRCIADNTKVVQLQNDHIDGYMNRGVAWSNLGNVCYAMPHHYYVALQVVRSYITLV